MGNGATSQTDLHDAGSRMFKNKWGGVFALDEPFKDVLPAYCIVNNLPRGTSGEHWVAVTSDLQYDSFGRKNILGATGISSTDQDVEQSVSENNCGQRCLAWLYVYDTMGSDAAKLI